MHQLSDMNGYCPIISIHHYQSLSYIPVFRMVPPQWCERWFIIPSRYITISVIHQLVITSRDLHQLSDSERWGLKFPVAPARYTRFHQGVSHLDARELEKPQEYPICFTAEAMKTSEIVVLVSWIKCGYFLDLNGLWWLNIHWWNRNGGKPLSSPSTMGFLMGYRVSPARYRDLKSQNGSKAAIFWRLIQQWFGFICQSCWLNVDWWIVVLWCCNGDKVGIWWWVMTTIDGKMVIPSHQCSTMTVTVFESPTQGLCSLGGWYS